MKRTFEEALEHRRSYYSIGSAHTCGPSGSETRSVGIQLTIDENRVVVGRRAQKTLGYRERYLESAYSGRGFCQDGG